MSADALYDYLGREGTRESTKERRQCVQSAFFRDSRVDHLSDATRRNKYAAAESIVSWLRADHPADAVRSEAHRLRGM